MKSLETLITLTLDRVLFKEALYKGEPDGPKNCIFQHTKIILEDDEGNFFFACPKRQYHLDEKPDPSELELHPIPDTEIYPEYHSGITKAPDPLPPGCYVKRPCLVYYEKDDKPGEQLSDVLLKEAQICEILRLYPHPNIVQYLGCQVEGERIKGICLAKNESTLKERLKDINRSLPENLGDGIEKSIEHMHSLGFIHNDINPANIMMNAHDVPVLIDFDACTREGDRVGKGGTTGWIDRSFDYDAANPQNDLYGLKKIREALVKHARNVQQR
ncbi:MAG: hypothetical protein M1836_002968 [Candelina mexicana]|nr:MAG: hypothetical protein M1836_002968 [Candelina mexicana]